MQGLDYSFSHPDLTCARQSGYEFVARYIGDPDPNSAKYLDAPELSNLRAHGYAVCVVRETTGGFMLTDDGGPHARASRAHCDALGMFGIPIYYALDVDPRALDAHWRGVVHSFLAEAAAADGGGHNVGIYGSDDALDWFMGPNCQWGWQTYAWSTGRISPRAHFRQYLNGQSVCGGTVDLNETYTSDFGQWPRPQENDMLPDEREALFAVRDRLVGQSGDRIGDLWNRDGDILTIARAVLANLQGTTGDRLGDIWTQLGLILDEADLDEVEAAALAGRVLAVLTPQAIVASIPETLAGAVAQELHERLAG